MGRNVRASSSLASSTLYYNIADLHYASQLFYCFSSSLEQLLNLFTADDKEQFATHLVRSHTVTHRTLLRRRSTHELDRQTRRQHQRRNRSTRPQFTSTHTPTQLSIRHPPRQRKPTPQHPITNTTSSGAKIPFPANFVAIAAGVAAIATIGSLKFSSDSIVPDSSYNADRLIAHINSGEIILYGLLCTYAATYFKSPLLSTLYLLFPIQSHTFSSFSTPFPFFLSKHFVYRSTNITFAPHLALVAKLVDAPDLGSGVARRVGSSPIRRTNHADYQ